MSRVKVRTRFPPGVGGYCEGSITMPAPGVSLTVGAIGADRAESLQLAAELAERLLQDPLLRSVLPPGTEAGVKAVSTLAKAARKGGGKLLKSVWRRFRGKGKKRLAQALALETRRSPPLPDDDDDQGADAAPESEAT